jgi:serine phosphatase RsbU (regulator of sigma subunit)
LQALYDADQKQIQIELLEKDKILQKDELKIQQLFIYSSVGALLSAVAFAIMLYRNNIRKQKVNQLLENQNKEIESQNIELAQQTEELLAQQEVVASQNQQLQQKQHELEVRNQEIVHKNNAISASINYAKRIQQAMLPFEEKFKEFFGDENYFIFYQPRDIVSGDFYFLEKLGSKIFIAVADCTGHGVPGAFMSMIGNQILYETIIKNEIQEPHLILNRLHIEIHRVLKQKETQTNDGMDIALIVIDRIQKTLEYAGAKNPLYVIQNQEFKEIKGNKFPIGGEQQGEYRNFDKHYIDLTTSSLHLYLTTDGYADQFGGENRKKYTTKRFKELLFQQHLKKMSAQKEYLEREINNWLITGKESQTDDITVVALKVESSIWQSV